MYSPVRFQAARAYLLVTTYCSLLTAYCLLLTTYCSLLTTCQAAMTDMFKGTAIQMRTLDLIATTYGTGDPDPRELIEVPTCRRRPVQGELLELGEPVHLDASG